MRNLLRVVTVLALLLLASALYYRSRPPAISSADETAVFEVMRAEMNPPKMSGVVPPECMAREKRSEERRVGKEWRSLWPQKLLRKKKGNKLQQRIVSLMVR